MKMSKMMVSCSFDQINAEQDDTSENDDEDQILNYAKPEDKTQITVVF